MLAIALAALALANPAPRLEKLPQNPYAQTDFTAYTLEFGEYRIGLGTIGVGVAPRVQVQTMPALDLLQVYNGQIKWNFLRMGPVDFASSVAAFHAPGADDFHGTALSVGGDLSVRVAQPWSVHLSTRWVMGQAEGVPDLAPVAGFFSAFSADDVAAPDLDGLAPPSASGHAFAVGVATDVRFNRRDALVLRAGYLGAVSGKADLGADLSGLLGTSREHSLAKTYPVRDSYTVSLSYQMSFRHVQLRLGGGHSAVPGLWALQAFDLSYRAGGATRKAERLQRKAWKQGGQPPS